MADDMEQGGERSGRYPGVALGDALEAAEKLYKAEKASPVSNATAVTKMGYKGLSGAARVMIGALRQYGLIERTAVGQFRLSKLAIAALHGTEDQKASARKTAALNPQLFRELSQTHLDASEDNVKSHLIVNRGFIDTGARIAAKAFRDTVTLANVSEAGYPVETTSIGNEDDFAGIGTRQMDPIVKPPQDAQGATIPPLSWVLSVPRGIRAELRITGKDVRREDLERLKKQIDFLVESFEDDEIDPHLG